MQTRLITNTMKLLTITMSQAALPTLKVLCSADFEILFHFLEYSQGKKQLLLCQNMPDKLSDYAKGIVFHTVSTGYLVGIYNKLELFHGFNNGQECVSCVKGENTVY